MFVANSDNLGASVDLRMLGHLERSKAPMLMEVCVRGEADRKGGHLARMASTEKKDSNDSGDKGKESNLANHGRAPPSFANEYLLHSPELLHT